MGLGLGSALFPMHDVKRVTIPLRASDCSRVKWDVTYKALSPLLATGKGPQSGGGLHILIV